ncbi:MAG: hypothetical protein FJ109_01160 [Deltaproteobacteria bacterium]|nr:hypothetical protein [Deltaproteobacteria bacterium]
MITREPLNLSAERPADGSSTAAVPPRFLSSEELTLKLSAPVRVELPRPVEDAPAEPVVVEEVEPNDEAASATQAFVPGSVKGQVSPKEKKGALDHDWYRLDVDLEHPRVMQLDLSPAGELDLTLELYREGLKGRELLVSLDNGGKGRGEKLPNFRLANGQYLVHVFPVGKKVSVEKASPYTLTLVLEDARAGVETEPNDDHLKAEMLALPGTVTGLMQRTEDQDWFQVDLLKLTPGTSRLALELLPPVGAGLVLTVFTQTREELLSVATGKGKKIVVPNVAILDGSPSYYLRVSAPEKSKPIAGEYTLKAVVEPLKERTEVEPDGTPEQAMRLFLEEALSGWLPYEGDEDWFRIEPPDLGLLGQAASHDDADGSPDGDAGGTGGPTPATGGTGGPTPGTGGTGGPTPGTGGTEFAAGASGAAPPQEEERPAFRLQVSGVPGINSVIELFEEDGQAPLGRYDAGGKGEGELIPNLALPVHPILVKLSASGHNGSVTYILQSSLVPTKGMEVEPNNRPEEATPLRGPSRQMKGYLALVGDVDCIRLEAPVPRLTVTPPRDVDVTVSFYDATDRLLDQSTSLAGEPVHPRKAGLGATLVCLKLAGTAERGAAEPWIFVIDPEAAP